MRLDAFIREIGLAMECEPSRHAGAWRCTLTFRGSQFILPYWRGIGQESEPTLESVLDDLARDAAGFEDAAGDFAVWASLQGRDPSDPETKTTFGLVNARSRDLRRVLGLELYDRLLVDVLRF